jgi:RNA polymerase sigma-70 factor (ECF subfamily)
VHPARKPPNLRLVQPGRKVETPPESPSVDDAQLLAALREGDEAAANAVYTRLHPRIHATVHRLLGPGDSDHDDCVQLAFVEIVRSAPSYRGESSLEHWAMRIAAHVVFKHIRRRRVERGVFERDARTSDRPEPMSTSRRLVVRDLAARIREKLDAVTPEKAYAFLLHDVLGFDLREIAQITSVSVAAAQQRLSRGRREIHEHIASDEELAALLDDLVEEA